MVYFKPETVTFPNRHFPQEWIETLEWLDNLVVQIHVILTPIPHTRVQTRLLLGLYTFQVLVVHTTMVKSKKS